MSYAEIEAHMVTPKRFATLSHLSQIEQTDYVALQETTGLSTPNPPKVLRDLEDQGLMEISKELENRYGTTLVRLTPEGRGTFGNPATTLNRLARS